MRDREVAAAGSLCQLQRKGGKLVKLLPAVAGGELLKIDGGGAVGDVGNAGACVSKR